MRSGAVLRYGGILLLLGACFSPVSTAGGSPPPNHPPQSGARDSTGLDLPALLLRPSDLDETGYGIDSGGCGTLDTIAAAWNKNLGGAEEGVAVIRKRLVRDGWSQSCWLTVAIPSSDSPETYGVLVSSVITAYADENGASDGLDLLHDVLVALDYRKARGAELIGDESFALRHVIDATRTSLGQEQLDLIFRVGNLVAELYMSDYSGDQPALETGQTLADLLVDRMTDPTDAPGHGLATRVLRLAGDGVLSNAGYYLRLDGDEAGSFGQSLAKVRDADQDFDEMGVRDVFYTRQTAAPTGSSGDFLEYTVVFAQFTNESDAIATMDEALAAPSDLPRSAGPSSSRVRRAAEIGDQTTSKVYAAEREAGQTADGFTITFRLANVIAVMNVASVEGVSQHAAEALAVQIADCMRAEAPCDPIAPPEELMPAA